MTSRALDHRLAEEQAALRRVATLVAEGAPPAGLFAAVAEEAGRVLDAPAVMLGRYEPDRAVRVLASWGEPRFPEGSRWPLDGPCVSATVLDTGSPGRIDDYTELPGTVAAGARDSGVGSTVGVPISVDGEVWGVVTVGVRAGERLPAHTEDRLRDFAGLVAIAISNADTHERVERLVDEQVALRRVAVLVAEGATTAALCAAVVEEVVHVLAVPSAWIVRYETDDSMAVVAALNDDTGFAAGSRWPLEGESLSATILETGRAARIDDFSGLSGPIAARTRESGIGSVAGVPITVDGSVWGFVCVGANAAEHLPADTETRLSRFTELVATSILNAESTARLRALADEQAALRRVATLVAEGATPGELFAVVAEEVARLLDVSSASVVQYEPDATSVVVASWNDRGFPVGSRWPLTGPSLNAAVHATRAPARIDHAGLPGIVASTARSSGIRSGVGVPIVVGGAVWGMIAVGRRDTDEPLPAETEDRLAAFTDLVATAVSNTLAHDDLRKLAAEQAALRRVATLVARAARPSEIVAAVAEEVAHVFGLPAIEMVRYDADGATVLANSGGHLPVGSRWPLDGPSIMEAVLRTGEPARIGDYSQLTGTIAEAARSDGIRSAIGAPIVVDGATWGAIIAISTTADLIPEGLEVGLSLFTDLVATAVSNLQAHDDLHGFANEHAALRRVATLVAEGATAEELFSGVATEVAEVLGVSAALLDRFEQDGTALTLAAYSDPAWESMAAALTVGMRWPPDPGSLTALIQETERAARVDDYSDLAGTIGETSRAAGIGSGCAVPILVDGRLWGAIRVFSQQGVVLPADTEARLDSFTGLVATAVSNAAARADLLASRARIVAAGDEARRRIERNLHDGTQQRLIALGLDLQRIRAMLAQHEVEPREGLERAERDLESVLEDVRELSRGLHPPLLSRGGLLPSLRALARRSPIPVEIDVDLGERPPAQIETALYYVISEALTNAIKHSQAESISVTVESDHGGVPFGIGLDGRRGIMNLHATVVDDGVGGAEATEGSGLMGVADRVDALGGRLVLESPPGAGTRIAIALPIGPPAA
jgi:GAF domain-containing protein